MKKKDNLTLTIEAILTLVKGCSVLVTNDEKYSLYLKKVSESTINGKSYEIVITDKKWNVYEESKGE
jgi:hypothetical protein